MNLPPNVILIGFMGSGKSSVGKLLAPKIKYEYFDTDEWIENKNNKKIALIFEECGEEYFRREEAAVLKCINKKKKLVISTGGGLWTNEDLRNQLLSLGWCIWLKVSPSTVFKRIEKNLSSRPLLARDENPIEKIKKLLIEREGYYSLAHDFVDTENKNPSEVANEIVRKMGETNKIFF